MTHPIARSPSRFALALAIGCAVLIGPALSGSSSAQVFTEPQKPSPPRASRTSAPKPPRQAPPPQRTPAPAPTPTPPPPPTFDDPVAYCAFTGTADAPGANYTGVALPDWIVQGIDDLAGEDRGESTQASTSWKCGNGRVQACRAGAGDCAWADVTPYSPTMAAGAVSGVYVGQWRLEVKGRDFKLRQDYRIDLDIAGGESGDVVATVSYRTPGSRSSAPVCRSQLQLVTADARSIVGDEEINYKPGGGQCPVWDRMTIQPRNGQLRVQWLEVGRRNSEVKMEGWAQRVTG